MDSSSGQSTASSRKPRKSRQLMVPADTLLQFAHYKPHYDTERRITRERNGMTTYRRPEQFAQANYRFAVDPHYDLGYSDCMTSPDSAIPWSAVDLVFMHHSYDCPICLHPLRCPRVTPCGHVFDFVCMVQHFSHSQDESGFARCPLCFSRICMDGLRACVLRQVQPVEVGRQCTMRLISRHRGHMLAHVHPTNCHFQIPKVVSSEHPFYSRLAFADKNYLLELTTESIHELCKAREEGQNVSAFVEIAVDILNRRKHVLRMRQAASQHPHPVVSETENQSYLAVERNMQPTHGRDPWYFYQVRDSRNVFLHPINHRCLVTEVSGDFARIETEISGTVLQVERYIMTERLRRRYRVLEHLPLGSEFSFVELDLSHIMSENTKAAHMVELRERSKARRLQKRSATREDRLAAKRRSEHFQEHLAMSTQGLSVEISARGVDGRDPNNFPALCAYPVSSVEDAAEKESDDQEENSERKFSTSSPSQCLEVWGSNVSSYSSVTSNMGLFPSLEETASMTSSHSTPYGSSVCHEDSADNHWRTDSGVSRKLFRSALQSRGGRKTHGRAKILWSNHGSACRP